MNTTEVVNTLESMTTTEVVNTLESMFKLHSDFKVVVFNNVHCDSSDDIFVKYVGHVYAKGYSCTLYVNYCAAAGRWLANVNGFNEMKNISNEIELKFAVQHLTQFSKSPCHEQELYAMNSEENSNKCFY